MLWSVSTKSLWNVLILFSLNLFKLNPSLVVIYAVDCEACGLLATIQ